MRLTKRLIDTLQVTSGQKDFWDESLPGFGIRVSPTKKVFIVMYRIDGRLKRLTLGAYGVLTLDKARDMAVDALVKVRNGEDPAADKQARRSATSVEELCQIYMERHATIFKRTWRNDARMIRERLLPEWGKKKAYSITRSDVGNLHQRIGKSHPYEANRTLALIRNMFNLWKDWGFIDIDNPATRIKAFPEEKRDRFIKPEELPLVLRAIMEEEDPRFRAYFVLNFLSGARKSELLTLKWEDLDLQQAIWRKPRTKAGRAHLLPLPSPIIKILQSFPHSGDNPYVFAGTGKEGHLVNVSKAWKRIREKAGIQDVRIHDIRRTLGSWMAGAGESLPLIGAALDHSNTSTTAIYARLHQDRLRKALEDNAARMLALMEDGKGVIELEHHPTSPNELT